MTRTGRAKLAYLLVLLALGGLAWAALHAADYALGVAVLLAVVFLVPGRVQGVVFRELFRGRNALDRGDPVAAKKHLEAFLGRLVAKPSRGRAIWLAAWIYTPSAEAMARNNLAIALLELGRLDDAEAELARALVLDPLYPLPWVQRAVIAVMQRDAEEARRCWEAAAALGYNGSSLDELVGRGQELLARLEGGR